MYNQCMSCEKKQAAYGRNQACQYQEVSYPKIKSLCYSPLPYTVKLMYRTLFLKSEKYIVGKKRGADVRLQSMGPVWNIVMLLCQIEHRRYQAISLLAISCSIAMPTSSAWHTRGLPNWQVNSLFCGQVSLYIKHPPPLIIITHTSTPHNVHSYTGKW